MRFRPQQPGWLTSGKHLQLFSGQGRKTRAGPRVSHHCCNLVISTSEQPRHAPQTSGVGVPQSYVKKPSHGVAGTLGVTPVQVQTK